MASTLAALGAGQNVAIAVPDERARLALLRRWPELPPSAVVIPEPSTSRPVVVWDEMRRWLAFDP